MPFAPYSNYVTILMLLAVIVGMIFNKETRISVIIGIVYISVVSIVVIAKQWRSNNSIR